MNKVQETQETRKSLEDKHEDSLLLSTIKEESQRPAEEDVKDIEKKERFIEPKSKEHFHRGKVKLRALKNIGLRRGKSLDTSKERIDKQRANKDIKKFNSKSLEAVEDEDDDDYTVLLNEEDYIFHQKGTRRPAICEEIERIVEKNNGTPLRTQRRNLIVSDNLFKWHLL